MKIEQGSSPNQFNVTEVSFGQLKTLRDACAAYAKQGSSAAESIAAEIKRFLENSVI